MVFFATAATDDPTDRGCEGDRGEINVHAEVPGSSEPSGQSQ